MLHYTVHVSRLLIGFSNLCLVLRSISYMLLHLVDMVNIYTNHSPMKGSYFELVKCKKVCMNLQCVIFFVPKTFLPHLALMCFDWLVLVACEKVY